MYCLRNRDILKDKHPSIVIIKIPVFHANWIEGRIGPLNVTIDISRDSALLEHAAHAGLPYGPVCVIKNILHPWDHVAFIRRNNCYGQSCCNYRGHRSLSIATSIICHNISDRGCLWTQETDQENRGLDRYENLWDRTRKDVWLLGPLGCRAHNLFMFTQGLGEKVREDYCIYPESHSPLFVSKSMVSAV